MGDKIDKSKFSLDLQREKRKTPPSFLPELPSVNITGVVTPLGQPLALTPCVLTAEDMQKIGVATPDMEKLFLNMNNVVSLSTASTPPQLVSNSKSLTSDKEEFCKELLQNMEANMKSRTEPSTSLPLSDPSVTAGGLQITSSAAAELLRTINSIKTVKLPLTGATSAIILPSSNLTAANVSSLFSTTANPTPVVRPASRMNVSSTDLMNSVHSAFGSPYPVAIVNPQPQSSVDRSSDMNSQLAATVLLGSTPRVHSTTAQSLSATAKFRDISTASSSSRTHSQIFSKSDYQDDNNSDYSLDDEYEGDDDDSLPTQVGFSSGRGSDGSTLTSSINLEDQECMKRERKRLRNRIAATKCRQKKIAKIQAFEDQIKELKRKHEQLLLEKASLKEKTSLLKENVLFHVKKGCNVIIAPMALTD